MNQISWHGYHRANRKDHSVFAIFLIYSIFSTRNQFSLFSRKAYDKLITMTEKRWGAHARYWAIAIFQLTELNIKKNPPCFQNACARGRAKRRHKLCAERMRDENVRNRLNLLRRLPVLTEKILEENQWNTAYRVNDLTSLTNSMFQYFLPILTPVYTSS